MAADRIAADVPELPVRHSAIILARQARIGIGILDVSIADIRTRRVKGALTAERALTTMLRGTGLRARRVAPLAYIIERSPPAKAIRPTPRAREAVSTAAADPEIVVTATKRNVPFSAYAGTVEIIAGDQITLAEAAHGGDALEARAVGLTSTHLGPGRNKLFIRGIADSSFVGPTEATVGQYWGEQRVAYGAPDPGLRLLDIERVEVLEGPQGTLYGTGSLGGLVRVVPAAPDSRALSARLWGGTQVVSHGAAGGDGGAVLNVPLVPGRAALRLVGYGAHDGGYIDDVARHLRDVNRVRTTGARAATRVDDIDGWRLDGQGVWQNIEGDDSQYADRSGGLTRAGRVAEPYQNHYHLYGLSSAKSWDGLDLTVSAGHSRQQVLESFEAPAAVGALRGFDDAVLLVGNSRSMLTTGEARIARQGQQGGGWVFGANLLRASSVVLHSLDADAGDVEIADLANSASETTLYGEYAATLRRSLLITVGTRLSRVRLTDGLKRSGGKEAGDGREVAGRTETRMLPSVSAMYRPTPKWTLFTRYQQGFRPGGLALHQNLVQPFSGDRVTTIEGGTRFTSATFDGSAALAWTRWRDVQADVVDELGFASTTNVGNGRVASLEVRLRWRPTSDAQVEAAANWNDGRLVTRTFSTLPFRLVGDDDRLPNVVRANARLAANYAYALSPNIRATLDGSVRYVGRSMLGIGSIFGRDQGDYVDTSIELRLDHGARHLSMSMTNLLDARGNRFALGSPYLVRDEPQFTPLQPRSLRLGLAIDM